MVEAALSLDCGERARRDLSSTASSAIHLLSKRSTFYSTVAHESKILHLPRSLIAVDDGEGRKTPLRSNVFELDDDYSKVYLKFMLSLV